MALSGCVFVASPAPATSFISLPLCRTSRQWRCVYSARRQEGSARRLRKRSARLIVVLADQAPTSSLEQAENAPGSKSSSTTAFFDSIGPDSDIRVTGLVKLFVPRSANVRSFGWASDRVVLFRAALPDGTCRRLRSRRIRSEECRRRASYSHKTDSPFCAGLSLSTRRAAQAREMLLLRQQRRSGARQPQQTYRERPLWPCELRASALRATKGGAAR